MKREMFAVITVAVDVGSVRVVATANDEGWVQRVLWDGEETRSGFVGRHSVDDMCWANVNVAETEILNGDPRR